MKIKKRFFLFILFLFIANNLVAQESPNPITIFNQNLAENNYLTPLIELQKEEFTKSEKWRNTVPDLLGYLYSYNGEYKTAYAQLDRGRDNLLNVPYYKELTSSPIDEYEPQTAIEAIATLADKNQVVMINEEHDTPLHRAFTRRLLPVLYAKGFRYLAAETLGSTEETMKRGYPTHKTGFYTKDPVFGEMIRAALRLGFKIIPYEVSAETLKGCRQQEKTADFCQNEREREQAQNLRDRILRDDPQAKILVHVGRGHNQQIKLETWAQMGWHFKEITGITPLSINQMLSERSETKYESGLYRYIVNKWKIQEPTVFKSKEGNYFNTYGYNLAVFHPRSSFEKGRPTWLKTLARRAPYTINLKRLKLKHRNQIYGGPEPVLIQAFHAAESADAIPADQIILYPEREIPVLMLPKDKYRIRALDKSGKIIGEYQI
jgi:hypothetical protein